MRPEGLEPPAYWFEASRSIQLSYRRTLTNHKTALSIAFSRDLCYSIGCMLVELVVENLAVVEQVRVRFHPGLNLLTGETGSGKSLVVDALGLLFGGRASSEMIRSGAAKARVSGIFELANAAEIKPLQDAGIECEDGELLIEREIQPNGKSRAFAGSRPVTAALLKQLAPYLGDIHGQHEQQNLAAADSQREMLDEFAGTASEAADVSALYSEWKRVQQQLEDFDRGEQEKLRLADMWAFQRKEIEAVEPKQNEDDSLEAERKIQKNVTRIEESAQAAFLHLYDDPASASAQLRSALKKLEDLVRIDAGTFQPMLDSLKPASIVIDDASHTLRDYLGHLEADPARLEAIETRLAAIEKLKRKYGGSIAEILAFLDKVKLQLDSVENASERRTSLEQEGAQLAASFKQVAAKLTAKRKEAAAKLEKRVEAELATLAMAKCVFAVKIDPAEWSSRGADAIEFLISANVGEELRPLDKVASGGEMSRVALALKTCTMAMPGKPIAKKKSAQRPSRTLVFDEVDAGIGGTAADAVGRKLKRLASAEQVLCVTHLAQVASYADHHYMVDKKTEKGRTFTTLEELDGVGRAREIGRMLSGDRLTPEALKHAEQMIKAGATA